MRSLILSFIILFSISCNKNNDKTIAFLDEGIKKSNQFIIRQNERIYTEFAKAEQENPKFVEKWKNKVDSIKIEYDKLAISIDSIKSQLEKGKKPKFGKEELNFAVSDYYQLLKAFAEDSASNNVINTFEKLVYGNNLSNVNLNLLQNNISVSTYYALQYLFYKIYFAPIRLNKIYPIIIPQKRYLKYGEYYTAEVYLSAIDTTQHPLIFVENDTLVVTNGIANYLVTNNEDLGTKKFNGRIEFEYYPESKLVLPFNVTYKVIK